MFSFDTIEKGTYRVFFLQELREVRMGFSCQRWIIDLVKYEPEYIKYFPLLNLFLDIELFNID